MRMILVFALFSVSLVVQGASLGSNDATEVKGKDGNADITSGDDLDGNEVLVSTEEVSPISVRRKKGKQSKCASQSADGRKQCNVHCKSDDEVCVWAKCNEGECSCEVCPQEAEDCDA